MIPPEWNSLDPCDDDDFDEDDCEVDRTPRSNTVLVRAVFPPKGHRAEASVFIRREDDPDDRLWLGVGGLNHLFILADALGFDLDVVKVRGAWPGQDEHSEPWPNWRDEIPAPPWARTQETDA